MQYTSKDLMRLAKRYNNSKRPYLLVNPLQGKHLPVSPGASLDMMGGLGEKLAARYPGTRLVVGFAETATAIGAVVASCFGDRCRYLHTTREEGEGVERWVDFQEEHSHATEQKLCGDRLAQWLEETPQVVFVDDELSTGKTLQNIVDQLRRQFPQMEGKKVVAASVLNRLSKEDDARLKAAGIDSCCLQKLPNEDYEKAVGQYQVQPAKNRQGEKGPLAAIEEFAAQGPGHRGEICRSPQEKGFPDPRTGVMAGCYRSACQELAAEVLPWAEGRISGDGRVLVLGTEECMYPALILGKAIEGAGAASLVRCHATTRSPIGISAQDGYPIRSGEKIHSFYEEGRETYLYNLGRYDLAIVVSDGAKDGGKGLVDVARAVFRHGCGTLLYVQLGGKHV